MAKKVSYRVQQLCKISKKSESVKYDPFVGLTWNDPSEVNFYTTNEVKG